MSFLKRLRRKDKDGNEEPKPEDASTKAKQTSPPAPDLKPFNLKDSGAQAQTAGSASSGQTATSTQPKTEVKPSPEPPKSPTAAPPQTTKPEPKPAAEAPRALAAVAQPLPKTPEVTTAQPPKPAGTKPETQAVPEPKAEPKAEVKKEVKPEAKPEAKPQAKPEVKPEAKPEVKSPVEAPKAPAPPPPAATAPPTPKAAAAQPSQPAPAKPRTGQATMVIPTPVASSPKAASTKQELKPATQPPSPVALEREAPLDERKSRELAMEKQFPFLRRTKIRYPFTGAPIPPSWKVVERYPVNSPFAYAVIADSPLLTRRYFLDEVPLTKTEAAIYSYLLDALESELTVPRDQVNPRQYFSEQARKILLKYSIKVPAASWSKIIYFAERDLVGFGVLDGLMRDPQIEDISIDAVGKPVFIYHKGHESVETNVTISDEDLQDNIITRLSHQAGKHVSTAFPIVQGTLPGRHRLIATFRREVSPQGSTATIRKFREDPLTIIDMLNLNLISHEMAAYAWYLMQNRATAIVVGASVDYETPMIYREGGQVRITEAGKLIDPYFEEGKEGRAYTSGIDVFCFDPKTYETRWSPIQYVYRHRHSGKMLRFRLQTGREVTVTRDHSIFILRNGRLEAVPANEIRLGEFVVASRSIHNDVKENARTDLLGLLKDGHPGIFIYDVPAEVFDRIRDVSPYVRRDWKHTRRLPIRYLDLLSQSERSGVRLGYKGSKARLNPYLEVDEGLARLLGYYVAEGAVKSRPNNWYTAYFTLGPNDKEMAEEIIEIIHSKFGTDAHIRKHRGKSFRVVASSRILVELLERWAGTGAGHKVVPEVILNSPSSVRRAFLKAWSRGDGGVTTSRKLMNGILHLLLMEGSLGTSYLRKSRGKTTIEGRTVNVHDSHFIRFPRPEELSSGTWRTERAFREPGYPVSEVPENLRRIAYKRRKVFGNYSRGQRVTQRSLALLRNRVDELLRYSGTPVKNEEESTHDGFYRSNSKLFDRVEGRLQAGQALLELNSRSEELERISRSGLAFLKVVGMEEVDSSSEFVYDVSVPECENFLAGFGGVFCHNTGAGKTTLLNALLTLTRLTTKIVTIEEVQEINIPHSNWAPLVARESYAATEEKAGEIGLFDLVKAAMRMRPDILVVGEVRGEEAYVLFQAISSVVGETPVLIREKQDVRLMPIGELVDRFYPGDSERVPVPVRGIDVLTFDKEHKVLFKPINYVLRHKADEIYSVRYNGGEVKATGSHSVFVFDENCDLVSKPVSDLRPDDVLASFSGSQVSRDYPVVDAGAILQKSNPEGVRTERIMPSCPHCRSNRTWKRGSKGESRRFTCKDCGRSFYDSHEGLRFSNTLRQSDGTELVSFSHSLAIPKLMRVDEKFARVLGIYMADGCVKHHRGSRVVFSLGTPEKQVFIDDLLSFFSSFGSKAAVDDRGTYSLIEFNHTPLAAVFEALCGRKLSEKHIPAFMWTSPRSVIDAFLDGWRADARRTLKGNVESYTSARPDLVNALSWLARLDGRTSLIGERSSKYRSANISRMGVEQKSRAVPVLPLLKLKRLVDSTAWFYGPDARKRTTSKERARKALQEILEKKRSPLNWEATRLISRITSLLDSPLIAAPLKEVTKAKFDGFVYDLSVPDTEAFFGGESPVALHNTGHGGVCTLHADDTSSAVQRLLSEPMNVPKSFLPFLDLMFVVRRISVPAPGGGFRSIRRVISVDEINDAENYFQSFKWDVRTDTFRGFYDKSPKLEKLARDSGIPVSDALKEIERRAVILKWMQQKGIRNFRELSPLLELYVTRPSDVYNRAVAELEAKGIPVTPSAGVSTP